ncbi:type III secretion apparatus protein, YscQ/HrcQ family [Burkholderia oklahomensis]|uniref:Type III secretion apparatus protein, YscQ/HrcQ family n=1 Tax=Burkholderia oklahomensis TaxID=342113 RepID=A0AAI8BDE0_9BURK|nr:type III secretion system cytoplasmic ring protein SctQ [Burkholderia oklahomensis]AIO70803.1 type III secretion apparatus protein, YscQ/HrcQ family [Burkholderia oklahomensis]AJX33998.1 type III secretion apparatus protein, YscQ/HrcQ family [Burkholderia oklahomensis C6786]SUY26581.1 type III secretion system protein [Burkholderia oklahomensis]
MASPFAVDPTEDVTCANGLAAPMSAARPHAVDRPENRSTSLQPSATHIATPAIAPFSPARITPAAARASKTLFDARIDALAASVTGLTSWGRVPVDDLLVYLDLLVDPAIIELSLGPSEGVSAFSVFIAIDLDTHPELNISAYPECDGSRAHSLASGEIAMRQAVAGILLAPLIERLVHCGLPSPSVVSVTRRRLADRADDDWRGQPAFRLSLTLDERRIDCAISLPLRGYDIVDALLRALPAVRRPALMIPGALIVGVRSLPVNTLGALKAGDVLLRSLFPRFDATLLTTGTPAAASLCAVAAWGARGHARLHAAVQLDVQSFILLKEFSMSEDADQADAGLAVATADEPARIGELELPVQFEIDTVSLPIDQLSVLEPGYVIELPVAVADARLRIVVHGQTVGFGELVAVGEHLGVRIIRMAHRHDSDQ